MALTEDATTPAAGSGQVVAAATGVATSSAAFTPPAGSLVVAPVSWMFSANATGAVLTCKDSAGTSYTGIYKEDNDGATVQGVFYLYYATSPGSITIKVTNTKTGAAQVLISPRVLDGAAVSQAGAGSVTVATNGVTALEGSVTTTTAGSLVYFAAGGPTQETMTAIAGSTTLYAGGSATEGDSGGTGKSTSTTVTPGATTFGWTLTPAIDMSFVGLEILPASGTSVAGPGAQVQHGGQTWRRHFRQPQQPTPPQPPLTIDSTGSALDAAGSLIAGGAVATPGAAGVDGAGLLIAGGSLTVDSTGSALDAAGSLIAGGSLTVDSTGSELDAAGSLTAGGSVAVPGAATVDAAGSLIAGGTVTENAAAALDGVATLSAAASAQGSGAAAVDAAGSLIAGSTVTVSAGAALDAAGHLSAAGTQNAGAALDAVGTLGTAAIQGVAASLIATGTLAPGSTISPAVALDAAGRLPAAGTQNAGAALDAVGTLSAGATITVAGGAALDAAGSVIAAPGTSGGAALDAAGHVAPVAAQGAGAALDAVGTLTSLATESSGAALDAAGSVIASAGAFGNAGLVGTASLSAAETALSGVALDAAGTLTALSAENIAAAIVGMGALAAAGTIAPAAALDGVGSIIAAGSAIGAAIDGAGSIIANGNQIIVPVQIARNSITTGTTCTVTLSPTTAGNTLVAVIYTVSTGITSVKTGTNAENWASRTSVSNTNVGIVAIWSDPICGGGATSVVVTQATSVEMAVFVYELPGNCILDQAGPGHFVAGGTAGFTAGTIGTTTENNEIWIGAVGGYDDGGGVVSMTSPPASPWVNQSIQDFNTIGYLYTSYQSTTSTGTPAYTGTASPTSANNFYGATVATFVQQTQGAAALVAAGALSASATENPVTALVGTGTLGTAVTEQPGTTALVGTGSLIDKVTQGAPTALQGTGSLAAVGYSVNAALVGTGTLATAATESAPAALVGTSSLTEDVSLGSSAPLVGTGTLSAIPGTSGGAALDAVASLSNAVVEGGTIGLDGGGRLSTAAIQTAGANLDAVASLNAYGFAIGAALVAQGSVIAASRMGAVTLLTAAGSLLTAAVQSPALEAYNFGSFPQIPNGSVISSVTVVINDWASTSAMNPITFELWDGTSAKIGTTQFGSPSTSPYNLDSATFTGVSYSQLATLRVRVYANSGSSNSGDQEYAGSVSLAVAFTPSTNAAALVSVLKEATVFPAATVVGQHNATASAANDIPVFTNFPAVTCGQLSINALPPKLTEATVFPAVSVIGYTNASITVSTLALAGNVLAAIVTATSTGPDYAQAADIQAGIGTAVGTWTSVSGVIGPPDAKEAVWTHP